MCSLFYLSHEETEDFYFHTDKQTGNFFKVMVKLNGQIPECLLLPHWTNSDAGLVEMPYSTFAPVCASSEPVLIHQDWVVNSE